MGKIKKTKRNNGNNNQNAIDGNNSNKFTKSNLNLSELEVNLCSLDENSRLSACNILKDLYDFNANTGLETLDYITTNHILSKLSMRLVDFSQKVKFVAIEVINNLSQCNEEKIQQKIINVGLFRSCIAFCMSNMLDNGDEMPLTQCLSSLSNIIEYSPANKSAANMATHELITYHSEFIDVLIQFIINSLSTDVKLACVSLLTIIISSIDIKTIRNLLKNNVHFNSLWNYINSLINQSQTYENEYSWQNELILIQSYEIFLTFYWKAELHSKSIDSMTLLLAMNEACHVPQIMESIPTIILSIINSFTPEQLISNEDANNMLTCDDNNTSNHIIDHTTFTNNDIMDDETTMQVSTVDENMDVTNTNNSSTKKNKKSSILTNDDVEDQLSIFEQGRLNVIIAIGDLFTHVLDTLTNAINNNLTNNNNKYSELSSDMLETKLRFLNKLIDEYNISQLLLSTLQIISSKYITDVIYSFKNNTDNSTVSIK
eukprot:gene17358-23973_t